LFLADGSTRIVMDYGAAFREETDDVRLARIFAEAGLPAAQVFDILPEAGALVLEDLGDDTLESALHRGRPSRGMLYGSAVELAAKISTRGTHVLAGSNRAAGPALDEERFVFEMRFFLEHYVGAFLGRRDAGRELTGALYELARTVAAHPRVLCHRDYHSRNIMVRADGSLALVDIQDARWGPDTYDLASLLRDAYVDIEEAEVQGLIDHYCRELPEPPDLAALRVRFELTSAQRMLKALGTFGYQIAVLGRERYRDAIPRTLRRLVRVLPAHTQTSALAEVLTRSSVLVS
jgi:aminoglycoside/choline kinase family phosphotransferase